MLVRETFGLGGWVLFGGMAWLLAGAYRSPVVRSGSMEVWTCGSVEARRFGSLDVLELGTAEARGFTAIGYSYRIMNNSVAMDILISPLFHTSIHPYIHTSTRRNLDILKRRCTMQKMAPRCGAGRQGGLCSLFGEERRVFFPF